MPKLEPHRATPNGQTSASDENEVSMLKVDSLNDKLANNHGLT
jgi:hypothetical protein